MSLAAVRRADPSGAVSRRLAADPADIEFAARRTAQLAVECVLFERSDEEVTTGDILHAIGQTRHTLTPELAADFEQEIQDYAGV